MRRIAAGFLASFLAITSHAENVLSSTDHVASAAAQAVIILGGTVGPSGTSVDQTCKSNYSVNAIPPASQPPGYLGIDPAGCQYWNGAVVTVLFSLSYGQLIALGSDTGATLYSYDSATAANHAPYSVLNQSSAGYTLAALDQMYYGSLAAADQIYMIAFCGTPQAGDYPPVRASTVLPSSASLPSIPNGNSGCGYGTGIEFSMTPGYKGFATGSPSGTTEAMTGVYSVLKTNHMTWTYGDVKAALRQTADSWAAGYATYHASPLGFGFGNVNYDAANALSGPSAIYLQAPGMAVQNHGYFAYITVYPFLTTRRAREKVFVGGTWPAASTLNEMTAAQVAAAGGTVVFDSGGSTGAQTFTYAAVATGTAVFTAVTLDAEGNASRVETYSQVSSSFLVGTACTH
jgi:hypothetical protein